MVIADDHPVVRTALRTALEGSGVVVCAAVGDAPAAVAATRAERPDVCVLDLHMPGNGLVAARRIAAEVPETAVVMLTVADDDETLFESVRAGVAGLLPKDMDLDRLAPTLEGVVRGEAAFPRTVVSRLLDRYEDRSRATRRSVRGRPSVQLTSREAEVVDLLREGLTTAQMAARLFVSPATVRSHMASALRKFGVPDRGALLALIGVRGEISTPD